MTLIVGLIARDGIALASDSRMTAGNPAVSVTQSNDTVRKIFKITDHCGMGISGSGEVGVTLIEEFQKNISSNSNNHLLTVSEITEQFRELCLARYTNWFRRLPVESERIPDFNILICGYSKKEGENLSEPKIMRLNSFTQFAPMTTTTGYATLGMPTLANYLLNRLYLREEIDLNQALQLAAFCIMETESQDGRVGGRLQAATFSNTTSFSELEEREINRLTIKCEELLRNSFQINFYKTEPKKEPSNAIVEGVEYPKKDAIKE